MSKKRGRKKRLCPKGGVLIGVDESNSQFCDRCGNHTKEDSSQIIIAGYLLNHQEHLNYNSRDEEKKGRLFNGLDKLNEKIRRAHNYLFQNPNFYFTTISRGDLEISSMLDLRIIAADSIYQNFLKEYEFNPKDSTLVFDDFNKYVFPKKIPKLGFVDTYISKIIQLKKKKDPRVSQLRKEREFKINELKEERQAKINQLKEKEFKIKFHQGLEDIFLERNLNIRHESREKADKHISAVIKADRVAYFLSFLNMVGSPDIDRYFGRKVSLDYPLENLPISSYS
jgi:hypothetical protein